jgi:hypothetical protein
MAIQGSPIGILAGVTFTPGAGISIFIDLDFGTGDANIVEEVFVVTPDEPLYITLEVES